MMKNIAIAIVAGVALCACGTTQVPTNLAEANKAANAASEDAKKAEEEAKKAEAAAKEAEEKAKALAATDDPVAANKAIVDGAELVDANAADAYAKQHHATAINIPAQDVAAATAEAEKQLTDKAKAIVIYAAGDAKPATDLRNALKEKGYTSVWAIVGDTVVVPDARAKAAKAVKGKK